MRRGRPRRRKQPAQKSYKHITKTMMARAYDVDPRTLSKWLEPLLKKVGKPYGRLFTPLQIEYIIKSLGKPRYPEFLKQEK